MVKAAEGLSNAGHRVFVASKRNAEILKTAALAGLPVRVFNIRGDFSPWNTWRIARFLHQEKIDVLICNLNKDVRVAGLAARLVKKPVVIARHGVQLCGKKWKHKVTLQHLTDGILTNSVSIRRNYAAYGWFPDNFVRVIYNGIEDKSSVQAYDFTREFPDKKIVFSAGRLSEQKGFSYLIETAFMLRKKRSDLVFIIAGKGRLENQLKKQIREKGLEKHFFLFGFSDNIDPFLKGCDLFVLSSLFEGMPNVVMEAMAVGTPVVATDVNGVRELMEDGVTGLVVPPRHPGDMSEAIEILIAQPEKRKAMGRAGQRRVQTQFTIPIMVRHLESYFTDMIRIRQSCLRSEDCDTR